MQKEQLLTRVEVLLQQSKEKQLKRLLLKQNFHDTGFVINHLRTHKRRVFVLLPPEIQAEVILALTDTSKQAVLERLSIYTIARFLHFNDEDDVADIISFLYPEQQIKVLEKLKKDKRRKIEKLLKFGPETAGGLMDLNFIIVKPDFTLTDVAKKVQTHLRETKQPPLVVVTEKNGKILGYIPYKNLILTDPNTSIKQITKPLPTIKHHLDQEKILSLIPKYKSDVIGVVDEERQILGIIHLQDLLKVAQEEATEDVYKFAGVSSEEDVLDPARVAIKLRHRWLILNLGTAFLASFVVSLFEGTISQIAILAAYMPIVAGMGGNAGTQTLAVVVRGLAVGHIAWENARRVIVKEMIAGSVNGAIVGVIVAFIIGVFGGSVLIGLILGVSMVINLIIAGLFGALIPLMLKAARIDPAIASSIFVTTATDVFGFLVFLGLATFILL